MHSQEKTLAAKLLLSAGERVLRSIAIVKEVISLGRRPYNDIALNDLTVSGEHAVIEMRGSDFMLRDNGSRNGTTVNGRLITEHRLTHGDVIGIGVYRLRFMVERPAAEPGTEPRLGPASLEYLNRPPPGEWVEVDRPIVSVRGSGNVAVVSRRKHGYFVTHLEGPSFPAVNGNPIGLTSQLLADGDLIELSGTMIRFRLRAG
jgi:hypothetical protein